jgi:hypothetical protein
VLPYEKWAGIQEMVPALVYKNSTQQNSDVVYRATSCQNRWARQLYGFLYDSFLVIDGTKNNTVTLYSRDVRTCDKDFMLSSIDEA